MLNSNEKDRKWKRGPILFFNLGRDQTRKIETRTKGENLYRKKNGPKGKTWNIPDFAPPAKQLKFAAV